MRQSSVRSTCILAHGALFGTLAPCWAAPTHPVLRRAIGCFSSNLQARQALPRQMFASAGFSTGASSATIILALRLIVDATLAAKCDREGFRECPHPAFARVTRDFGSISLALWVSGPPITAGIVPLFQAARLTSLLRHHAYAQHWA